MPIERRPEPPPRMDPSLTEQLVAELRTETRSGPRIIEEKVRGLPRYHVTVIWDAWDGIDPTDRSAMILDAYKEAKGDLEMLRISVAIGLTRVEADRLGVH